MHASELNRSAAGNAEAATGLSIPGCHNGVCSRQSGIPLQKALVMSSEISLSLHQEQIEYLAEVGQKYNLPDAGKAIRCLLNFAIEKPDQADAIFTEVRCRAC